MCFSMRRTDVCPVEERRILRKSAFWMGDVTEKRSLHMRLTEKRILHVGPHGKAHSARHQSPRVRLFVRARPRVRFSVECAFPHLGKRGAASRKSAFSNRRLTEKCTLQP